MTPKAFASILLRVLGLWFAFDALFRIVEILVSIWPMRGGPAATGWTTYPPLETTASELYLHDTYYVISNGYAWFVAPGLKLLIGLVLLLGARWFARLLCAGVDEVNRR
jgi:hypothetical protein